MTKLLKLRWNSSIQGTQGRVDGQIGRVEVRDLHANTVVGEPGLLNKM